MTGRIPIRTALSVVVVPGDPNGLTADTPTIAEFYKKNGYRLTSPASGISATCQNSTQSSTVSTR